MLIWISGWVSFVHEMQFQHQALCPWPWIWRLTLWDVAQVTTSTHGYRAQLLVKDKL